MTSPGGPVRAATVDAVLDAVSATSAPAGGATNRHAVAAHQDATTGTGAAVFAETTNPNTAALVVRGPGPLIDLQDRAGRSIMQVGQSGFTPSSLAVTGAVTAASVTATGAVAGATVAATGAVTGASATLTGAVAAGSIASTGAVSGTTITGTGDLTVTTGDLIANTAGKGLKVKEGANARMGVLTLTGATPVAVATTAVTANSRIFLTTQDPNGGTPTFCYVTSRIAGTSFTVQGVALDASIVAWLIVEPA